MRIAIVLVVVLTIVGCKTRDPELVWCVGDGTEALIRGSGSKYFKEAWETTDHPLCEGKPRATIVFMDQQPMEPISHVSFPTINTELVISDTIFNDLAPSKYFIADDFSAWERDGTGWKQLTTKQKDHVWVGGLDSRYDHGSSEFFQGFGPRPDPCEEKEPQ